MNFKIYIQNERWRNQTKKKYMLYAFIYRKFKLMHSDRKQVSDCSGSRSVCACGRMEEEKVRRRVTRGVKGNFGEQWIYFCYLDCGEGFTVSWLWWWSHGVHIHQNLSNCILYHMSTTPQESCLDKKQKQRCKTISYIIYICCWQVLSCVQLSATPWTAALQAPLSMEYFQARILEWVAISFSRYLYTFICRKMANT